MAINLSDRDVRQKFLQCHYSVLSSCFLRFYQEQGQGLLVIVLDEDNTLNLYYETDLSLLFTETTLKNKVYPRMLSYNPKYELLVGFQLKEKEDEYLDNCILHSIGSSNFPVKLAAEIAESLFQQAGFN